MSNRAPLGASVSPWLPSRRSFIHIGIAVTLVDVLSIIGCPGPPGSGRLQAFEPGIGLWAACVLDERLEELCRKKELHLEYDGALGSTYYGGLRTYFPGANYNRWRVIYFRDRQTGELVSPRLKESWFCSRLERGELQSRLLFFMSVERFGTGAVPGLFREQIIPITLGPYRVRGGTLGPSCFEIHILRDKGDPGIDEPVTELGMSIRQFLKQVEGGGQLPQPVVTDAPPVTPTTTETEDDIYEN